MLVGCECAVAAVSFVCREERARELLAPVLKDKYYGITEVRLSTKSFSDVSVAVLADVLKQLPSLTIVDMDDIISGRMDAEALRVIEVGHQARLRFCSAVRRSCWQYTAKSLNCLGDTCSSCRRAIMTV
jgi:Ran GTPase-activating protein (RanGAP) involved in mRNA processing and transport